MISFACPSDHVVPLLRLLSLLPIFLELKTRVLSVPSWALRDLFSGKSLVSSAAALFMFRLLLDYNGYLPTWEPLYYLFPLPAAAFSQDAQDSLLHLLETFIQP